MLISKNHKKYPPLSFLFLSPWPSDSLAVSDCFHSANTLPLAKRMLFTMSMMLGIGYSRSVIPLTLKMLFQKELAISMWYLMGAEFFSFASLAMPMSCLMLNHLPLKRAA